MAFAFDSHTFGKVLDEAERVAARAGDLERALTGLVKTLEASASPDLVRAARAICVEARTHRQLAETLVTRFVGELVKTNGSPRPRRVLVVDDTPDNVDLVTLVLEHAGFEAITARNGLEAVIVAHYARPAVILMDLTMPVLNGLEAARLLKASTVTHGVNVIAYTAKPEFYEPPFTGLFVDVVTKPATPETILASVQRYAATE
jgi:CheY-like chemotaxis protein